MEALQLIINDINRAIKSYENTAQEMVQERDNKDGMNEYLNKAAGLREARDIVYMSHPYFTIKVSVEGEQTITLAELIEINSEANGSIPLEESDIEAVRSLAIGGTLHIGLSEVKRIS